MRPFTSTISLDEARRRLDAGVRPIERVERVTLADAAGRVSAEDVASTVAVPPFTRSAMDGYAVIAADTVGASRSEPVRLRVIEQIYAGQMPSRTVATGSCAEIATGAPLPAGADSVVMVEETGPSDAERVLIYAPAAPGQNLGRRGADISPGELVLKRGDHANPGRVGAAAAIGCAELAVYAQPVVAVLSTGNEVVEPGTPLADGQVYDVNRFTLAAVIAANGGVAEMRRPAKDTLEGLIAALDGCASADIIIFSGGSSVGERDLVVDLVASRGQMIFHGIAVKPGKPTVFATIGDRPFFGMPGNPTSCLSNAYILLVPFLRATARLPLYAPRTVRASLGQRIASPAGRHQFYTVRLRGQAAYPAFKGSGDITSLSQADGYLEIPADQSTIEEGTIVEVTLF
jgi:molybdenum cofactor synthesis domain-containing protein